MRIAKLGYLPFTFQNELSHKYNSHAIASKLTREFDHTCSQVTSFALTRACIVGARASLKAIRKSALRRFPNTIALSPPIAWRAGVVKGNPSSGHESAEEPMSEDTLFPITPCPCTLVLARTVVLAPSWRSS